MKPILEYIISKSSKRYVIKATDETIQDIIIDELDRLGDDADLNHIDVSEVTDMSDLFNYEDYLGSKYRDLNPDISKWNVSNVENMRGMFYECYNFNCDLSKWDVKNVKDMHCMFYFCKNFNQDISRWNVKKVEDMYCMFYRCINFNQNISRWDVSNVENTQFMFKGCKNFNQDLSGWALSKISSTMFEECPIKEKYKP